MMSKLFFATVPVFLALVGLSQDSWAKASVTEKQSELYKIDLSDWPNDVVEKMKKEVPEMNHELIKVDELNVILKKLDQKLQFESLRFVQTSSTETTPQEALLANRPEVIRVRVVGEIAASIEQIEFENLKEISEQEALSLMNLNLKNGFDEETLKQAADKLVQYFHEQGYRFAEIKPELKTISSLKRNLVFHINLQKQTHLTAVKVEGIDSVTQSEIEKQLQIFFFRPVLNQDTLNKIASELRKILSRQGYFLTMVPEPKIIFSADELSAKIIYQLQASTAYSIEIINAKEFSHLYLENDVLKLDQYASKDPNFGADIIDKLKNFYTSQGYPHIEIAYYEQKKGDRILMSYSLDEGPFTRLASVKFQGQISRPESEYQNKFFELASAPLKNKIFIKADIEAAAKNLVTDLQNEGFVNARLGRVQISTDRENINQGQVIIQIEEGPQVQLDSIDIQGLQAMKPEQVQKMMKLDLHKPLSLNGLEAALQNLKTEYNNLGYIEFKILNEQKDLLSYSEQNSKAHLKLILQEGPRIEVQSILIEGNERTKDKLILTEIDFKPGDILTPSKIDESVSRLQRTGHFSSADITTVESGTPISQRTVLIKVIERDPGVFTIGAGATNENKGTARGYTGVAYRNIGGWGRGLSARVEGNYNFADVRYLESKFTLGGVEPYLLDSRARLRVNVTRSRAISDYSIRKVTETNSGVVSVEQDFTSHFTGIWELLNVSTYIDHGITKDDELKYNYERSDLVIGSTGPTLDFDYRDNFFNPTSGSFTQLSAEYASDFLSSHKVDDFIRSTAQTTWYFPIQKTGAVFAQSFRGGYIQDLRQTGYGIPFDKKGFTLGGRTTIRGFESSEFFPSTQPNGTDYIGSSYKLSSYASYELIKSEIRFPLVPKWDLTGAFFYDGGQVLIDGFDFADKWRDAVGFGLRYNTPIGPLNLEYGHKLDKKVGESEGAFHLSVGVF